MIFRIHTTPVCGMQYNSFNDVHVNSLNTPDLCTRRQGRRSIDPTKELN